MNTIFKLGCVAVISTLAVASSAVAQDRTQLIAAAGITATMAEGLSLGQIAAYKFNRGADMDRRQPIPFEMATVTVDPARHGQLIHAAGLTPEQARGMSISELAVAKFNEGADSDERVTQAHMFTRGASSTVAPEFIAAAGLTPEEARGLTLNEIYAIKLTKEGMGNYDQ